MANLNGLSRKFMDRMFKRVPNLVWDLTTGKLGIQDANGIYTLDSTTTPVGVKSTAVETTYNVSVNPIEGFGIPLPAFATQVEHANIKIGDLVIGEREPLGWVIDKKEVALSLLDKSGMRKNYTPPKVQILGGSGALVVQSLVSLTGGDGFGALQGSLLPLMMMGEGNLDLESILPMMLLTQTQGAGNSAMQSMMPMILMSSMNKNGGGSSIEKMLPLMMMTGGFGGAPGAGAAGGMNPMMMAMLMSGNDTPSSSNPPALRPMSKQY